MNTWDMVIDVIARLAEIDHVSEMLKEKDDLSIFAINSVSFIRLVVELEKEFGIEFEDEALDYKNFTSVQSICDYIESKCKTSDS